MHGNTKIKFINLLEYVILRTPWKVVWHFDTEKSWICHIVADSGKLKVQWRGGWVSGLQCQNVHINLLKYSSNFKTWEKGRQTTTPSQTLMWDDFWGFHSSWRIQVHKMWCTVAWLVFTNTSKAHSTFIFKGYTSPRTHSSWNPQPMKAIRSFETSGATNPLTLLHISKTTWTLRLFHSVLFEGKKVWYNVNSSGK